MRISHYLVLTALLVLGSDHLNAQNVEWKTLDEPFGGCVDSFVFAPDGVIYAYEYRMGPVRSTDDGATWQVQKGGGNAVVVLVSQRGTMFVYDKWNVAVRRSGAGALPIGSPLTNQPLLERPNSVILMSGSDGLFRSTDDGETWVHVGPDSTSFRFAANGPGNLILAVSDTSGLYRSSDEGITWIAISSQPAGAVLSLVALESGDIVMGTWFAVYRSSDLGQSFTRIALENVSGRDNGLAQLRDGDLLVATRAGLFRVDPQTGATQLVTSTFWKELGTVAITPSGTILLGYCGRGIVRSTDNGSTFEAVGLAAAWPVFHLEEGPDGSIYVGVSGRYTSLGDNAVYRSTDRGASWVDLEFHHDLPGRILIIAGGTIIILGGRSVYRSTDNAATWQEVEIHSTSLNSDLLATRTGELLVSNERGITRSTDDGVTWTWVLENVYVRCISESPNGELWGLGISDLLHSSDRGETWTTKPLTAPFIPSGFWAQLETPGDSIFVLKSHNALPELARSTDAGSTWDTSMFHCGHGWTGLYDQRDRGMFLVTQCGIYMSRDRGARWDKLSEALGSQYGELLAHSSGDLFFGGDYGLKVASLPASIRDRTGGVEQFSITPNPSHSRATISFSLSRQARVVLTVRNVAGELIGVYHDAVLEAGQQRVGLEHQLAPGAYVVEVDANGLSRTMIMLVVQ